MHLGDTTLDLRRPYLVGILNATPDSFSDGGELADPAAVAARGAELALAGADLLDVGGESTRPGAAPVSVELELARVVPAILALRQRVSVPIAVDTRHAAVAAAALRAGAVMVNDGSGFGDPAMGAVVAAAGAAWVLMHCPIAPAAMGWTTRAEALPDDVEGAVHVIAAGLAGAVARAQAAGVARTQLSIDPGLGFGKSLAQNLALLRRQPALESLGLPLYLGPSRKSFLGGVVAAAGRPAPGPRDRLFATAAAVTAAVLAGAAFVRVHDVAALREVVDVAKAIRDAG
ncbi:MAG: dihydropteroate synthase [Myxococcales bacterium]|nr:dihydropteroate synthase [Myxococcales bacterium]